jgi:hypothetical protein
MLNVGTAASAVQSSKARLTPTREGHEFIRAVER